MAGRKILLVEGNDDKHVLKHICGERGVGMLEVKPQGNVQRLLENFPVRHHRLRHRGGFHSIILEPLGEPLQPPPIASAGGPPHWEEDADQREVAEDAHDLTPTRR